MLKAAASPISGTIDSLYRAESPRILATLIRLLGDFDLAEEALAEAFVAAVAQWPAEGVPSNPRAWLISTGRFKGIDSIRKRARADSSLAALAEKVDEQTRSEAEWDPDAVEDDRLRLIFTCCHPALPADSRAALTLREVCGLTTDEIARAFLTAPTTVAQRIVRAKAKIREAGIPYQEPSKADLPELLDTALRVIYLVFNEGYAASSGDALTRPSLSTEAIRLAHLLADLLPEPEVNGLLALMLLHESRRAARATPDGDVILLDDQDRSLWNRAQIAEGKTRLARAFATGPVGPYALQAAIALIHAESPNPHSTDWARIVQLYDALAAIAPSPVIDLNRAVAIALRDTPADGLALIDPLIAPNAPLAAYPLAHSARADLHRRLGNIPEARASYERALALTQQGPERRFLEKRLREMGG